MGENTMIFIIRHGESVGNLHKICLGHTDLGLTDRGREQAASTANALKDVNFEAIYSSELIRAIETALLRDTSYSGNSSVASFDAEYTDAPASFVII